MGWLLCYKVQRLFADKPFATAKGPESGGRWVVVTLTPECRVQETSHRGGAFQQLDGAI